MQNPEQISSASQENEDSGTHEKNERLTLRVKSDDTIEKYTEGLKPQLEAYVRNPDEFINQARILRELSKSGRTIEDETVAMAKENLLSMISPKLFVDFYGRDSREAVESLSGLLDLPTDVKEELQARVNERVSMEIPDLKTLRHKDEEVADTQTQISQEAVPQALPVEQAISPRAIPQETMEKKKKGEAIRIMQAEKETELDVEDERSYLDKLSFARSELFFRWEELKDLLKTANEKQEKEIRLELEYNESMQDRIAKVMSNAAMKFRDAKLNESSAVVEDLSPNPAKEKIKEKKIGGKRQVVVERDVRRLLAEIGDYIDTMPRADVDSAKGQEGRI